jgi:hypothetical protein
VGGGRGGNERTAGCFERVIKVRRELGQTKAGCSRDFVRSLSQVPGVKDLAPTHLAAFRSTEKNRGEYVKARDYPITFFFSTVTTTVMRPCYMPWL